MINSRAINEMMQRPAIVRKTNKELITEYFRDHGLRICNPEQVDKILPQYHFQSFTDLVIEDSNVSEPVDNISEEYDKLQEFVNQSPPIHQKQLKPLLFAFFYNTVVLLHKKKRDDLANAFFDQHTKGASPENAFHSYHSTDIKNLKQDLNASTLTNAQRVTFSCFHAYMTENTFQALITFLSDNSFNSFLLILKRFVRVIFVPINYFSNRVDTNFIFHSVNQSEEQSEAFISLLNGSPTDLAKKFLGQKCDFEIVDDDISTPHSMNPDPSIPPVYNDRVMTTACDIENMHHLSKNELPSCAYFTFHNENISYDINYNGSLIAVSTPYRYTQLFATSLLTDLEYSNAPTIPKRPDLVPRLRSNDFVGGSKNKYHYFNRTLIGPHTYCCRFSPESRLLLCTSVSLVRLWQLEQASAFSQISVGSSIIWCADWSPYGYHYVCGDDQKGIWMVSIDRSQPLRLFCGHQDAITAVKFHDNAVTLASASYDRSVMLWDVRENTISPCTRHLAESNAIPLSIVFSKNGRVVVTGDDCGKITAWDIGEARKYGSVTGKKGEIRDMSISQEGAILASAGPSGEVTLWDMSTLSSNTASNATPLKRFSPRHTFTNRLSFSSRNLLHAIGSIKT